MGEIDIIAKDKDYYVFVEVKYRRSIEMGYAGEALDHRKIKKICKVADYYRLINDLNEFTPTRYDVFLIDGNDHKWIQNAFDHIY